MTESSRASIRPAPTTEEAAAIVAALEVLRVGEPTGEPEEMASVTRSRWRLAGLLGHALPPGTKLEGPLWAYSSWKGGL